jgi:hypothetical protein
MTVLWISFMASYLPFLSIEVVVVVVVSDEPPLVIVEPLPKPILTLTKLKVSIMRCLWHRHFNIE